MESSGPAESRSVSVFVAPPSQRPVLSALVDLSAAGLLAPFAWIESDGEPDKAADRYDPVAVWADHGQVTVSTFSRIVNRHDLETVRLLVVVPVGHPVQDALPASAEQFYQLLGVPQHARRESLRVMVPYSAQPLAAELGRIGWRKIMLSPESTSDPAYSAIPWWTRPETIPGAAAVGLAVQAGLCGAVNVAPHDGQREDVSYDINVVRSFVRIVDAHSVEDQLRRQVTEVGESFPQPTRADTGVRVPAYADPEARVAAVAQAWQERHIHSLRRPQVPMPERAGARRMGALEALKLFFSFLVKALIGAPGEWLRSRVRAAKASIASGVASAVFGEGSAVQVVVGGVDSNGRTVGWNELTDAAKRASDTLPADFPRSGQPVQRDFGALWQDLVSGTIALLDGSAHSSLGIQAYEGYLPRRDAIAAPPGPKSRIELTEPLGDLPAGTVLHSWDQLEVDRVRTYLQQLSQSQHSQAPEAARRLAEIDRWRADNSRRLLPRLGAVLSSCFTSTRNDVVALSHELQSLLGQEPGGELEQRQRRLARILRLFLLVLAIVLVVLVVSKAMGRIGWLYFALLAVVTIIGWLAVSISTFVSQQREVFRILFRIEERDQRIPLLTANLRLAVEDLAAQGAAYSQFRRWATIVSAFLDDPLGARDTGPNRTSQKVALPEAIQRVEAEASPEHLADAAASLRTSVFTVGWLTQAWETMRAGIGADLDPEQRNRLATRQLVLTAESGEAGSALSNWAQGLQTKGVRSGQAGHIWQKCLAILSGDQGPDPRLTVVTPSGERRQVSAYCHDLTTGGSRSVVLDVLGPVARSGPQSLTVPDQSWLSQWNDGLSPTMVLVETTNPIAPADFIYPDHDQSPSGPLAGMDYFNVGRDQTAPPAGAGSSSNGAPGDTPTGPESLSGPLEY